MPGKRGKHQSLAPDLRHSVAWLESLVEIKRVIIGISESCRHQYGPGTLRARREVLGGILISAYSGRGVTDIFLNISPVEKIPDVIEAIKERFPTQKQ